jgi:microtubule-associated protein-like 6
MGEDGALRGERARFGKKGKLQTVLCCAFAADGSTLTGMSDGKVYRWNGKQLESVHGVKGWKQAVVSIVVTPHSVVIGGRKGIAFLSLPDLSHESSFDLMGSCVKILDDVGRPLTHTPAGKPPTAKSLSWTNDRLLIGTSSSQIFELVLPGNELTLLLQGHCSSRPAQMHAADELFRGEVRGLATHPTLQQFVTCGNDSTLRIWDIEQRECVALRSLLFPARCAQYSPDGSVIAVGSVDGSLYMLNAVSLALLTDNVKVRKAAVTDMKFAPDGRTLAVASDTMVDLYSTDNVHEASTFKRSGVCKGHNAEILHLDWAQDCTVLRTCSDNELVFWDVGVLPPSPESAAQLDPQSERCSDAEWATNSCQLGWAVQGAVPESGDASDLTCCASTHSASVIAVGGASASVSLFAFPCVDKLCEARVSARAHGESVANMRWSCSDDVLLSVGGADLSICQWRHGKKPRKPDGNTTTESTDQIEFEGRVDAAKRIQRAFRQRKVRQELRELEDRRQFLMASLHM